MVDALRSASLLLPTALQVLLLLLLVRLVRTALPAWRVHRTTTPPAGHRLIIACPGGGVFFWWQLGAVRQLLDLYELPPEHVVLSGASAGALAVVFGQANIDPAVAYTEAFRLADEAGCLSNPIGLCGKWGRLVYAWLEALLPEDAAMRCSGRCRVAVTRLRLPLPQADGIGTFAKRSDLISALMASTHIPFFMDGRPTSRFVRGTADGELLSWLSLGLLPKKTLLCPDAADHLSAILIDHAHDDAFRAACRQHGWSALSVKGTERFSGFGAAWVRREAGLGANGQFAALAPYRRGHTPPAKAPHPRARRSPRRPSTTPEAPHDLEEVPPR